jgi:hypothetical protein
VERLAFSACVGCSSGAMIQHTVGTTTIKRQKGNSTMMEALVVSNVTCAIVCAKWALDLGFSQLRQIIFLIGGLLFGPLVLLVLYVFLVNQARRAGQPGGKIV